MSSKGQATVAAFISILSVVVCLALFFYAFIDVAWSFIIAYFMMSLLIIAYMILRLKQWPEQGSLSPRAKEMYRQFGHFYNLPFLSHSLSGASSTVAMFAIAMVLPTIVSAFWWGFLICLILYVLSAAFARMLSPHSFLVGADEELGHREAMLICGVEPAPKTSIERSLLMNVKVITPKEFGKLSSNGKPPGIQWTGHEMLQGLTYQCGCGSVHAFFQDAEPVRDLPKWPLKIVASCRNNYLTILKIKGWFRVNALVPTYSCDVSTPEAMEEMAIAGLEAMGIDGNKAEAYFDIWNEHFRDR